MNVINDFLKCAIRVEHTSLDCSITGGDLSLVKTISIQRRIADEVKWEEIKRITVITTDDVDFVLLDFTARSYQSYEYRNVITADKEYVGAIKRIESCFDGILVANREKYYVCLFNPEYTYQRDFNVSYVKPYNSQYPHSIHNGIANSSRGTIRGYFNPIGNACNIEMKYGSYVDEFVNFLSDGTSKLIKTYDGHIWLAQIDTPIKFGNKKMPGLVEPDFSWTEVGRAPIDMNTFVVG